MPKHSRRSPLLRNTCLWCWWLWVSSLGWPSSASSGLFFHSHIPAHCFLFPVWFPSFGPLDALSKEAHQFLPSELPGRLGLLQIGGSIKACGVSRLSPPSNPQILLLKPKLPGAGMDFDPGGRIRQPVEGVMQTDRVTTACPSPKRNFKGSQGCKTSSPTYPGL